MTVRTNLGLRAALLALAVAATAAGCTSGGSGSNGQSEVTPPPVAGSPSPVADGTIPALPLDGYGIDHADSVLIGQALDKALTSCMASKGFTYQPAPAAPAQITTVPIDPDHLGLISMSAARSTGYQFIRGGGQGQEGGKAPAGAPAGGHGAAYDKALAGDQAIPGQAGMTSGNHGCMGVAEAKLGGATSGKPPQDVVGMLIAKSVSSTASDSRVQAAMAKWASCMKGRGYNYSAPTDASAAAWPQQPSAAEISTAVADMTCKQSTGLLDTWYQVEGAYQQELIQSDAAQLDALRATEQQRLDAAKKILAAS